MTTETEVPIVAEVDCATNTISYRPMTDNEIEARKVSAAEHAAHQAERQAALEATEALKESAKAKLVAGDPLTEEEASVLVI